MGELNGDSKNLIVYDVGSTYTKIAAFTRAEGKLLYLGRAEAPTTVENITVGLQNAKYNLSCAMDLPDFAAAEVYATSSAAGGLRMVAMGFMPRVTAKAAKEVAMSAGARVLEILSYEDKPCFKVQVLREIDPDLILLAGGTDNGDEESILENTQVIVESKVKAVVIIAGNSAAQPKVEAILNSSKIKNVRVANVMPTIHELKVKPARQAIHEQFIRQITRAQGLAKLKENVTNGKVIPTPGAVLLGAELLAGGTQRAAGLGELLVVDIGGATTDVHSALPSLGAIPAEEKGLVINNEKQVSYRTVEGNLGLRVSATGIVETAGPEGVLQKVGLSGQENGQRLRNYAAFVEKHPEHVGRCEEEKLFDEAMAATALEIALKRHAGYLAVEYDPLLGVTPGTPLGRDLRKVKLVIGVGGIFTHASRGKSTRIIEQALANPGISLLPSNPRIAIDQNYLLYAIGATGEIYPDEALEFAKAYLASNIT